MPYWHSLKRTLAQVRRKHIIAVVVAVVAFAGFYYWAGADSGSTEDNLVTAEVMRGNIYSTVKVVGKAKLANEQKLRFNQVGKVAAVYVKEGDEVKKDQLIASLDETDALSDIKQNETNLANSQLNLQELLNGSTRSQLLSSRNAVADTKQKIAVAKQAVILSKEAEKATISELDRQLELAKLDIANKQKTVEIAAKDLSDLQSAQGGITLTSASNTYAATVSDGIIKGKSAIAQIDTILDDINAVLALDKGTEELNDYFENNLGALDSSTLIDAQSSFWVARRKQKDAIASSDNLDITNASAGTVLAYLQIIQDALIATTQVTNDTYALLGDSISSASFVQSELDSLKSSMISNRNSSQSQLTAINGVLTKINDLNDPSAKENTYKNAVYSLQQTQNTLKNLELTIGTKKSNAALERISKENELKNLQNNLIQQEAALKDVERGPTSGSVALAKNSVTLRELDLEKARKALETKYQIRAPFDGAVSTIDFKVGDNLVADDTKYVYIQNADLVQLAIALDQVDVVKVKLQQSVEVIFDALPGQIFEGSIEAIDPAPVEQSGVVSYEATITIDRGETRILSGMTAAANVIIAEEKNVLTAPTGAISSRDGENFVRKIVDGQEQRIKIEIGISDGKKTAIKSGLLQGDIVVVFDPSTMSGQGPSDNAGSQNQTQNPVRQIFRATGTGGDGPH
ncbi:MAG: efflux RND transporter periplasmic adaptor subunit [Patescibacteria group bacterium]